jgi:hypothetical protein
MLQLKQLQDIKETDQIRKQRLANQIKQNGIIKNKIAMIQQNNIKMINKMIENKNKKPVENTQDSFAFHQFAQVANNMNNMNKKPVENTQDSSSFHQFAQVANNMNNMNKKPVENTQDSFAFHQFAQLANRQFI